MPRRETANPTDRIARMLVDFDTLESANQQYLAITTEWARLGLISRDMFESLPLPTVSVAVIEERFRQRSMGAVLAKKRAYMRRKRSIQPERLDPNGVTRRRLSTADMLSLEEVTRAVEAIEPIPDQRMAPIPPGGLFKKA